jgi:transcription elongation factor Elf1
MALKAIFGDQYGSYPQALRKAGMTTLTERRAKLTKKFAIESYSHDKFKEWYKREDENTVRRATRLATNPNLVKPATPNNERLGHSAIPKFIEIINENRDAIRAQLDRRYTCLECPVTKDSKNRFNTKKEYIKHLELKHKLAKLSCMECGETLQSKPALDEHIEVLHAPRKQCQICEIKTGTVELLKDHLRTHPMSVTCTECSITLANRPTLRQHMYKHHEAQMTKCDQCGTRWTSKTAMLQHKKYDHVTYTEFSPGQPGHTTVASITNYNLSLSMNAI